MSQNIAVAVIHGMGSQEPGYSEPMRDKLSSLLGNEMADHIDWAEIHWANVLAGRQKDYLESAERSNDLNYPPLRSFVVEAFGDASAYRKPTDERETAYKEIHARVDDAIRELDKTGDKEKPLIFLAHSLGGHIMSNYIYDMQKLGPSLETISEFRRLSTLAGIVTFGCNIPLFTLAYDKAHIEPIRFPGSGLSEANRERARWLNYYDPDDLLGYPLKPINDAYNEIVNEDIPIDVGSFWSRWTPWSHREYWTDNDFTRPVANFLRTFLT